MAGKYMCIAGSCHVCSSEVLESTCGVPIICIPGPLPHSGEDASGEFSTTLISIRTAVPGQARVNVMLSYYLSTGGLNWPIKEFLV